MERFTNMSKVESGFGGSYGRVWKPTSAAKLLHFDGILVQDGVLGGSSGALHRRWELGGTCYNNDIATTMTMTRFRQLKASMKLCHNSSCPKRGEPAWI